MATVSIRGRFLSKVRMWREMRAAGGIDGTHLALIYHGWHAGHRIRMRDASSPATPAARAYLRCTCGWEGRSWSADGMSPDAYVHLSDEVRGQGHLLVPKIDVWPPGITPQSSIADMYRALEASEHGES
jgi:hypothetical protein